MGTGLRRVLRNVAVAGKTRWQHVNIAVITTLVGRKSEDADHCATVTVGCEGIGMMTRNESDSSRRMGILYILGDAPWAGGADMSRLPQSYLRRRSMRSGVRQNRRDGLNDGCRKMGGPRKELAIRACTRGVKQPRLYKKYAAGRH